MNPSAEQFRGLDPQHYAGCVWAVGFRLISMPSFATYRLSDHGTSAPADLAIKMADQRHADGIAVSADIWLMFQSSSTDVVRVGWTEVVASVR
jgi:hypothetical protein